MAQAQQTMMNPGAVVAVGANGGDSEDAKPGKPPPKMQTPALFEQVMAMRPSWDEARNRYLLLAGWQRMMLWAILALLVSASAALYMSMPRGGDEKVLFSNLNDKDAASIVASLQQMQVPYKYSEGGGAILVPAAIVHDTRIKLAGQGLPKGGFVGFELLENQKLGTSQFVEQVNFQRALEGELARTVQALGSVQRRLRNCMNGVRAQLFAYGSPELVELEAYLASLAVGMPLESPAVRP
jgi:hypothetical protein